LEVVNVNAGKPIAGEWQEILKRAQELRISPLEVEKNYLREGIIPLHYTRNLEAISPTEQIQLLDAWVGVCGCGGLGLYVISHLARMGVGHLCIWDPDVFSESNLNRQLLASYATLGQRKVEVCRRFIREINPAVSVTALPSRWEESDPMLFRQQQVMVDALDNIPSRLALGSGCAEANIPLVHGAVGGWYGQLTVIMPGDNSLQYLYRDATNQGLEKEQGTLPFTAAVIASLQAAEVIKLLLQRESDLRDEICMVDLLDLSIERFQKCNMSVT
jgi:molybdopterin/thiamine biosynthesis adenylyltransferase